MEYLIEKGTKLEIKDNIGKNAYEIVKHFGHIDVEKLLKKMDFISTKEDNQPTFRKALSVYSRSHWSITFKRQDQEPLEELEQIKKIRKLFSKNIMVINTWTWKMKNKSILLTSKI